MNCNNGSSSSSSSSSKDKDKEDRIVESIYRYLIESICKDVAANMHELIKTGANDEIPSSWQLFSGPNLPNRRELYPELYNSNNSRGDSGESIVTDDEIQQQLEKYAVDLPSASSSSALMKILSKSFPHIERNGLVEEELISSTKSRTSYKDSDDDDDNTNDDDEDDDDEDDDDDEEYKIEEDDDDDIEDDDEESDYIESTEVNKKKRRSLSSLSNPSVDAVMSAVSANENNDNNDNDNSNDNDKSNEIGVDIWGKRPLKEPRDQFVRCRLCDRLVSTSRFANHLDKCMGLSMARGGGCSISSSIGINSFTIKTGMITSSSSPFVSGSNAKTNKSKRIKNTSTIHESKPSL